MNSVVQLCLKLCPSTYAGCSEQSKEAYLYDLFIKQSYRWSNSGRYTSSIAAWSQHSKMLICLGVKGWVFKIWIYSCPDFFFFNRKEHCKIILSWSTQSHECTICAARGFCFENTPHPPPEKFLAFIIAVLEVLEGAGWKDCGNEKLWKSTSKWKKSTSWVNLIYEWQIPYTGKF